MRALITIAMLVSFLAGCACFPGPSRTLLSEADAKMSAEDWNGASTLYSQFLGAYPDHSQADRVRATRTALERLRAAQAAHAVAQAGQAEAQAGRAEAQAGQAEAQAAQAATQASFDREVPRMRRDLAERQSEIEQLKGEVAKLRADLDRLRTLDLQEINKPVLKK